MRLFQRRGAFMGKGFKKDGMRYVLPLADKNSGTWTWAEDTKLVSLKKLPGIQKRIGKTVSIDLVRDVCSSI
jgi:hypothetical protein